MSAPGRQERTLLVAGTKPDNDVLARTLGNDGIETSVCDDMDQLCAALREGAAVAVVAEECLRHGALAKLRATLAESPPWFETPIVVMARRGGALQRTSRILHDLGDLARVTFLERPVSVLTLTSAVRAALASRHHQYRVRDTIEKLESAESALKESESRLRLAVEGGPVVLFGVDRDLRYTWVTHAENGLARRLVAGKTDTEILGPEQSRALTIVKRRVLETGEGERLEHWICFDGNWTAWDLSLEPVRNDGGEISGLTGVTVEITDRKQAERKLTRAESRLRAAVEGSGIGVFEYDPQIGRLDATARSWRIVTGKEDVASGSLARWTEPVHPEDREKVDRAWNRSLESGAPYEVEYRVVHPDGSIRWVAARGQVREETNGGSHPPGRLLGTVQDVTEERHTEERLRVFTEELERLVTARTEKLRQRTDQLRRLANQLVFAEQRERSRLAQLLHDHLQQILAAAKIQVDVLQVDAEPSNGDLELSSVQQLLDQAVQASRSLSLELSPPTLQNGPLAGALKWQAQWMESHHKLETNLEFEEELPGTTYESKILLFDAMRELLFNTVKHAGVDRCTVRLFAEGSELCLAVEDRGKGFDPHDLGETGAEGFGLFSIRERIEAMGGRMEIESSPGKGSSFLLYVPATMSRPKEITSQSVEPSKTEPRAKSTKKIRLLVVDDHPIVRDGLVSMIRRSPDMEVVGEAADGEEAVELADLMSPDVIVMDINMPRMDGLQATREIKHRHPGMRIVGLSIQGEEAAAREMERAGASAFLPKGGRSEVFFETLRKVMAS